MKDFKADHSAVDQLLKNLNAALDLREAKFDRREGGLDNKMKAHSVAQQSREDRPVKNDNRGLHKFFGKLYDKLIN